MAAAKTARMTRIPPTRTTLSCEPNALMAKFLTAGGVKSMDSSPTATTGELPELIRPAISWATPRASPPARIPAAAPRASLPAGRLSGVTVVIRSSRCPGLPA